jgi:hypothetical protein
MGHANDDRRYQIYDKRGIRCLLFMTFIARIKTHSVVWRNWNGARRTGGVLHGVRFAWEPGDIYRSEPLTAEQIALLRGHEGVILEAVSVELPPVAAAMARTESPVAKPAVNRPIVLTDKPPRRGTGGQRR